MRFQRYGSTGSENFAARCAAVCATSIVSRPPQTRRVLQLRRRFTGRRTENCDAERMRPLARRTGPCPIGCRCIDARPNPAGSRRPYSDDRVIQQIEESALTRLAFMGMRRRSMRCAVREVRVRWAGCRPSVRGAGCAICVRRVIRALLASYVRFAAGTCVVPVAGRAHRLVRNRFAVRA
jgi:hypothetical protein